MSDTRFFYKLLTLFEWINTQRNYIFTFVISAMLSTEPDFYSSYSIFFGKTANLPIEYLKVVK